MIGAIIGDIVGSPYESGWMKRDDFELFRKNSMFTDDTVLTVAVADAILSGAEYEDKIREYANQHRGRGFGKRFKQWLGFNVMNDSFGNGSAMRVSPIGFAFDREDEVLEEAEKSAVCSHNHPEAIKGAKAVALSVYMAKNGYLKEEIRSRITDQFGYDLNRTVDEIRPDYSFDSTCKGSVGEAIVAFLDSKDYEDAIRKAVSLGGDADTLACMAGGIAQAYYKEIPEYILVEAWKRIPFTFRDIIGKFHENYKFEYRKSKFLERRTNENGQIETTYMTKTGEVVTQVHKTMPKEEANKGVTITGLNYLNMGKQFAELKKKRQEEAEKKDRSENQDSDE